MNFAGIIGPVYSDTDLSTAYDSVRVYVAMTSSIDTVYENTDPISLFPGANLIGIVDPVIRQRLKPATLGTLGFEVCSPFALPLGMAHETYPRPVSIFLHDRTDSANGAQPSPE